jgi:hypothetical protein
VGPQPGCNKAGKIDPTISKQRMKKCVVNVFVKCDEFPYYKVLLESGFFPSIYFTGTSQLKDR